MIQLELELWEDLERAKVAPVEWDFDDLLDKFDVTVANTQGDRRLALAGEAISRLAGVWQVRAEEMLLDWRERFEGARLEDDWLGEFFQPPDAFNLAEYEIPLVGVKKPRPKLAVRDEPLPELDKQTVLAWADEREREISTMEEVIQLAHEEAIQEWGEAIARVLERNEGKATIQMLVEESEVGEGKRSLEWVEVVLGSLLSQKPGFRLLGGKEFYGESDRVWVHTLNS
ncbi:MAG: hypothetical protein AAFY30_14045 [Cyanobacteria bacterium J06642_12]